MRWMQADSAVYRAALCRTVGLKKPFFRTVSKSLQGAEVGWKGNSGRGITGQRELS